MQVIKHASLEAIEKAADKVNATLVESPIAWSFRIFEAKQTKTLHVYYKPLRRFAK